MTVFTLACLQGLLREAKHDIQNRKWRKACETLRSVTYIVEKTSPTEKMESQGNKPWSSESCTKLLLECGKTWNSLLHTSEAQQCFKLALKFGSFSQQENPTTNIEESQGVHTDVIFAKVETHLHDGDPQMASQVCHEHFSRLSYDEILPEKNEHRDQKLILKIAEYLSTKGHHNKAVHILATLCPLQESNLSSPSSEDLVIKARKKSIFSEAKQLGGVKIPGDHFMSAAEAYVDALLIWERAHWPLEYAETIIKILGTEAMVRGEENDCPSAELMLSLHDNLWKHSGHSVLVAKQLFELIRASCKKGVYHTVMLYGKPTVEILAKCNALQDVDRIVLLGQTLCLVAPHFLQDAVISQATDHLQECVSVLAKQVSRKGHQQALSAVYLCLAFLRKLFPVSLDELLYYTGKVLELQDRLSTSVVRSNQLVRADALHRKGFQLEKEGHKRKADMMYDEADHIFSETIANNDSSFEFIVYGCFLLQRKRFASAEIVLLTGYLQSLKENSCLVCTRAKMEILPESLQFEVQCSESGTFVVPSKAVALYFRVMALSELHDKTKEISDCVRELEHFAEAFDFGTLSSDPVKASQRKAASLSLLGYTLHLVGRKDDGRVAFQKAYSCYNSTAAEINMQKEGYLKIPSR